jgi:DNA-binding response OmpR family regulator
MMPGMDGFATLDKIREISNVPVMLLSARSRDEDVMHGYSAGADLYLVKPMSMETLHKAIDYLIGDLTAEQRAAIEQEI